jgi:hypothetical protein
LRLDGGSDLEKMETHPDYSHSKGFALIAKIGKTFAEAMNANQK